VKASLPLVCASCGRELAGDVGVWSCPACRRAWRETEGIILAPSSDEETYWGEIPRAAMRHLLWRARVVGPETALLERGSRLVGRYVSSYALDWRRALCLELADVEASLSPVLDYGAGWGTIGLAAAAGPYPHVVLADSSRERLAFSRLLAAERSLSGITYVATEDASQLPYGPDTFGLIVLNGVVEWLGSGRPDEALAEQRRVLRRLWGLVRPSGVMYVGIENRFALKYLRGYPDDHSELRYSSVMPRALANAYSRYRRKRPYSTVTWSLREWRRAADFLPGAELDIYVVWPDYRFPVAACLADDSAAVQWLYARTQGSRSRRLGRDLLCGAGVMGDLAYSFGVVIRKRAATATGDGA